MKEWILKEGHKEAFLNDVYSVATSCGKFSYLGWGGQARMFQRLGLRSLFGIKKSTRRIETKKIKKALQMAMGQMIMSHIEQGASNPPSMCVRKEQ